MLLDNLAWSVWAWTNWIFSSGLNSDSLPAFKIEYDWPIKSRCSAIWSRSAVIVIEITTFPFFDNSWAVLEIMIDFPDPGGLSITTLSEPNWTAANVSFIIFSWYGLSIISFFVFA